MIALLAVPVLAGGYALLGVAALTGATVLAWDGARLFLASGTSPHVLHQRRYASSMMRALTSIIGVLLVVLFVLVTIGAALAAAAVTLL